MAETGLISFHSVRAIKTRRIIMNYIHRSIEPLLKETLSEYAVVLLVGPRQVGKSTVIEHVTVDDGRQVEVVTLDDLTQRSLAQNDPAMFFELHEPPVLIDEVQYAPELFTYIKMAVDRGADPGSFLLTGSQQFRLMELAGESLAGRIAILSLSSLDLAEEANAASPSISIGIKALKKRSRQMRPLSVSQLFEVIQRGFMPAVVSGANTNLNVFYSSYIQTYIERDVRRLLGKVDALQFMDFMRAVAARCSQMLNVASIAEDVGIRPEKAKAWLAVLERSGIIFYLHPYANNQLKRTVKKPKLYFHDCGIVAYLTRWSTPEALQAGAMNGAFVENFAVSEIWKAFLNAGLEPPLYYFRDKDGNEIDVVIEMNGKLHPIEIKKTASPNKAMTKAFSCLDGLQLPRSTGVILCMASELSAIDSDTYVIPLWMV